MLAPRIWSRDDIVSLADKSKTMPTKAQERIAKGLCPQCGEEAAPYYLCSRCRLSRRLGRARDRLALQGVVTVSGVGRQRAYAPVEGKRTVPDNRWSAPLVPDPDKDKRFRPRLRGVAVNVEAEVIGIFERAGIPLSVDDVIEAWVKLRADGKRKHGSAAKDVRAIILAKRRREERAARRASSATRTGWA